MSKIIYLVTEDWYFCSHRLPLAVSAKQSGHNVMVATRIADHQHVIEESGIHVIPLRRMKRSSLNVFRELATFFELLAIFRREQPDLVHLVALKPVVYGSLAAKLSRVPARVNALGGLGFIFSSNKFLARLLRPFILKVIRFVLNDSCSRLILQNQDDLALLTDRAGVDRQGIHLIRSAGVDLDQYTETALPEQTPIVMLASRMLWDKGIGEFVSVATLLHKQKVNARFVLVGDSDLENPSSVPREQLQEWNDSGVVEWWGYCNHMPEVLPQASIVCLPSSYGEGVPKILIEAMACARPIITTDMPGCRDLVKEEKNGLLVEPKNTADLADALTKLINNPSLCQKMGLEGRRIVEKDYSLAQVIDATLDVYQELLNK